MTKGSFAKEDLMEDYLASLLTEEPVDDVVQRETVAKLLETANAEKHQEVPITSKIDPVDGVIAAKENSLEVEKQLAPKANQIVTDSPRPESSFQALFFNVAGLTLALPLTELGGIHKLDKIGPLFGKPSWFKGVMLHRDEKLSVVDTAKWVMPEKYDEKLAESLKYQYLIMLDNSGWGLACEKLVTTATLQPSDVKWREAHGKRVWLAGMVKEKMCALINVQQLIAMLNKGHGSNDK